jgi:hypothetical protein
MSDRRARIVKRLKWLGKRVAAAALALVVVASLFVAFLHTGAGGEFLRGRIEQRLRERVTTSVDVGRLDFSLFSGVTLDDVAVYDRDGKKAIVVKRLHVAPRLGEIVSGTIGLDDVTVTGVTVDVAARADGTTNLTGLGKPSEPSKKKTERIIVRALAVRDVAIHFTKPDGTRLDVDKLALEGKLDTRPPVRATDASLSLTIDRLAYDKPEAANVVMTAFSTKAAVDLAAGGQGKVKVGPTVGQLVVTRKDVAPFSTKLSLPDVTVDVSEDKLAVALSALEIAALAAVSAQVEVARAEGGGVDRVQSASITRLSVKAADVEALAGRPILAGDLTIDVTASGPKDAFVPEVRVATAGGEIKLRAKLNLTDPNVLHYEATLETKALDVKRVAASEKIPPLVIGELSLTVKGERREADKPKLAATLALRDTRVRDVTIDSLDARARLDNGTITVESLELRALGQRVEATGTYAPESKAVDVTLVLDARVAELLAKLRAAGVLKQPPSPLVSALSLGRPAKIRIHGKTDGEFVVETQDLDARVAGGSARATVTARLRKGDPDKKEPAFVLADVDANLALRAVSLDQLGRMRGKPLPVSGLASGRVRIHGDGKSPNADVDVTVALVEPGGSREPVGTLRVVGGATASRVTGDVTLTSKSGEQLAHIDIKGARAGRGVGAPLDVTVDVPERPLSVLAPFLRPEVRKKLPPFARVGVHATAKGRGRVTHVEAGATARLDPSAAPVTLKARADVAGPITSIKTAPLTWAIDLDVPETALGSLPLPPDRAGELRGTLALSAHLKGTRADATGDVVFTATGLEKGTTGPIDARVTAKLSDAESTLDLDAKVRGVPVVEGRVKAALAGAGLLTKARAGALSGADPALSGTLRIPEAPLASWGRLAPRVQKLPGHFGGELVVRGSARSPELALALDYAGYKSLDGKDGRVTVRGTGTRERAHLEARANDALTLAVDVSPREILEARAKDGGEAKVHASLDGQRIDVATLIPDSDDLRPLRPEGTVDAKLVADATLVFRGDTRELGALALRGPLTVKDGTFVIPTTSRRIHHVRVEIEGDGDMLAIRRIEARESDRAEASRSVNVDGAFAVRTRELSLHARAYRVLVSGGSFGEIDAPRGALDADLSARVALGDKVRRVEVDVRSLELLSPDRQPRAVQQEVLSLGDVLELRSVTEVGKLPVPPPAPKPSAPPNPEDKTLDVIVRIPNAIHFQQRPLDLFAKGEVHVERFGERRVLSGKLVATGGALLVGGRDHKLEHGEVRMADAGPFLDLHFAREPHPASLRDVATVDGADIYAHMVGPLGKQKISFSGKADGIFEALSMEGIGRVRVLSTPDRPLAQTAQLPQVPQIRQTAYMGANLPHLGFLDRMNTYADPNAGRFAYGRFETMEAERYSKDGTRRLRTTVRPRTIGQSDAEVEGSFLFTNTPRVVSGVGLVGGTRFGGGPAVFWEWSSED